MNRIKYFSKNWKLRFHLMFRTKRFGVGYGEEEMPILNTIAKMDRGALLDELRQAMHEAAANLEFEKAARLRDEISRLEAQPAE